jgi:CTP:molybdopterin cytidylyltransferase MocA
MCKVVILIPAAGASSRMRGRDKLLEQVDGLPLLARQAAMALETGSAVLVSLPSDGVPRQDALAALPGLDMARIDDPGQGLAASIRAGAHWAMAQRAGGLMVVLADMPDLQSPDLSLMIRKFATTPDKVLRATDIAGRAGHPVIFPARLFPALTEIQGDTGARDILRHEDVTTLPLPGYRATTDLDTPEDWAAWRARRTP